MCRAFGLTLYTSLYPRKVPSVPDVWGNSIVGPDIEKLENLVGCSLKIGPECRLLLTLSKEWRSMLAIGYWISSLIDVRNFRTNVEDDIIQAFFMKICRLQFLQQILAIHFRSYCNPSTISFLSFHFSPFCSLHSYLSFLSHPSLNLSLFQFLPHSAHRSWEIA